MSTGAQYSEDLVGALVVGLGVLGVFALSELARIRAGWRSEATRKFSHAASGLVVLLLPILVESPKIIWGLAASMVAVLWLGQHLRLLQSIHGVSRRTSGAYFYPLAIALLFQVTDGNLSLFAIPVLILALADSGAALMGEERGAVVYRVLDGERSLEGSLTFFSLSLILCLGGLSVTDAAVWPNALMVALVVAVMTTAVESISIRGFDNLLIPYVAWVVLERSLRLGLEELEAWAFGILMALTVVVLVSNVARLTVASTVAVFVLIAFSTALGGAEWVAPWLLILGLQVVAGWRGRVLDYDRVLPAVLASLVFLMLHVHLQEPDLFVPYLASVVAGAGLSVRSSEASSLLRTPLQAFAAGGVVWLAWGS